MNFETIFAIGILILASAGFVTNLSNLICSILVESIRKQNSIFVVHLILADLGGTVFILPQMAINILTNDSLGNDELIRDIIGFITNLFICSSLVFIALLGYSRYVYICNGQLYQKLFTKTKQHLIS